jgi:NAD(P)H-hydrate epimerase
MATGGSGDVLSGVIGALLAQGLRAWDAACLGVFVHGRAGDRVAARRGPIGLVAGDLAEALPEALASLS